MSAPRLTVPRVLPAVAAALCLAAPGAATAYRSRLVLAVEEGRCSLRLEADDDARSLRLRVAPEAATCAVSSETVERVLTEALSGAEAPRPERAYTSLYLGRLVDYPWLASRLATAAAADPRWNRRTGRPTGVGVNALVAALLSRPEVLAPFESALHRAGYRIRSAMVEKVLVGTFRDVPGHEGSSAPGKVPFDAMVWLVLARE